MNSINKIFFRGLITLLPIAVTIYILYSAVVILDSILGSLIRSLMPESFYVPGIGFFAILILIYLFGLMLNNFMTARLLKSIERRLTEVPFIKTVYSPLRDLMNLFSKNGQKQMGSVVLVQFASGTRAMGLVTRETFEDLSSIAQNKVQNQVAVYFPFSYGLGGMTLLVSADKIEKIDIPVDKALSLAITGWVHAEQERQP